MKIRLVGGKGKDKKVIDEVVKDLNCSIDIEEISEENKKDYNIKHTPAIIIENVVISEDSELSYHELKDVLYQFMET